MNPLNSDVIGGSGGHLGFCLSSDLLSIMFTYYVLSSDVICSGGHLGYGHVPTWSKFHFHLLRHFGFVSGSRGHKVRLSVENQFYSPAKTSSGCFFRVIMENLKIKAAVTAKIILLC